MKKIGGILFLVLMLALGIAMQTGAQLPKCAECGMMVDQSSRFSATYEKDAAILHFCDIGDLIVHLIDKKLDLGRARVKDFATGDWISASSASYVSDAKQFKTPMNWGIAAFQSKEAADKYGKVLTIDGIKGKIK